MRRHKQIGVNNRTRTPSTEKVVGGGKKQDRKCSEPGTFTLGAVISEMGSMIRLELVAVTERKVLRGCFACG